MCHVQLVLELLFLNIHCSYLHTPLCPHMVGMQYLNVLGTQRAPTKVGLSNLNFTEFWGHLMFGGATLCRLRIRRCCDERKIQIKEKQWPIFGMNRFGPALDCCIVQHFFGFPRDLVSSSADTSLARRFAGDARRCLPLTEQLRQMWEHLQVLWKHDLLPVACSSVTGLVVGHVLGGLQTSMCKGEVRSPSPSHCQTKVWRPEGGKCLEFPWLLSPSCIGASKTSHHRPPRSWSVPWQANTQENLGSRCSRKSLQSP